MECVKSLTVRSSQHSGCIINMTLCIFLSDALSIKLAESPACLQTLSVCPLTKEFHINLSKGFKYLSGHLIGW